MRLGIPRAIWETSTRPGQCAPDGAVRVRSKTATKTKGIKVSARTIQETDAGDRKIELVGRAEGDPEFYVDGVHGVQVTGPIVKINLYTLGIETDRKSVV